MIKTDCIDMDENYAENYDKIYDDIKDSSDGIDVYFSKRLEEQIESLDDRSKMVIKKYYGLGDEKRPKNLYEIGREMNLTYARIAQLKDKALRILSFKNKKGTRIKYGYNLNELANNKNLNKKEKLYVEEETDKIEELIKAGKSLRFDKDFRKSISAIKSAIKKIEREEEKVGVLLSDTFLGRNYVRILENAKIKTLRQLSEMSYEEIAKLLWSDENKTIAMEAVDDVLRANNYKLLDEEGNEVAFIDDLDFTKRQKRIFESNKLYALQDIKNYTKKDILNLYYKIPIRRLNSEDFSNKAWDKILRNSGKIEQMKNKDLKVINTIMKEHGLSPIKGETNWEGILLPSNIKTVIERNGIKSLDTLLSYNSKEISTLSGIGKGKLFELRKFLYENGLCLKGDENWKPKNKEEQLLEDKENYGIADKRGITALKKFEIHSIEQLDGYSYTDLIAINGIGKKIACQILDELESRRKANDVDGKKEEKHSKNEFGKIAQNEKEIQNIMEETIKGATEENIDKSGQQK